MRTVQLATALLGFLTLAPMAAQAADVYPSRPIRVILGPTPEATPRLITERLQRVLGQAVVLEPRLGAGGEVAAKTVAGAEADGYTPIRSTPAPISRWRLRCISVASILPRISSRSASPGNRPMCWSSVPTCR